MRRNLVASRFALIVFVLLCFGSPTYAATSCAAGNPNTTSVIEWTPTTDFSINGDGTVTHLKTGLMWKQCAEGLSGASCNDGASWDTYGNRATHMTWGDALIAATVANIHAVSGYTDWRLPNKKELESIVEACGTNPSINKVAFPATPSDDFWSSSTTVADPTIAWRVYFGYGTSRSSQAKANSYRVRLVRGGQSFDLLANPSPPPTVTVTVYEFYNTRTNHYFRTSSAQEMQGIVNGSAGPGWERTFDDFNAYAAQGGGPGNDVCRFYSFTSNSHFFTASDTECNSLKTPGGEWNYEGLAYRIQLPVNGICSSGLKPVYRLYNGRYMFSDSNHRFTTSFSEVNRQRTPPNTWSYEGVAFCAVALPP